MISRGKTIHTAVSTALELLETSREHVVIEIIEPESKGLWGRAKPAVVRVTLQRGETSPSSREETPSPATPAPSAESAPPVPANAKQPEPGAFAGKAWIQDGVLRTKDAPDKYPLVTPCRGVLLHVNGIRVETTTPITEKDVVSVTLEPAEEVEPVWDIHIDDRWMAATLRMEPGYTIERRLEEAEPVDRLLFRVRERKRPKPLDPEVIHAALRGRGVVYGIRSEAIEAACRAEAAGEYEIAAGERPAPGTNGSCTMVWEEQAASVLPRTRQDGTVDFREHRQFPSVTEGQVLAVIHPSSPGKPGKTIAGEPVEPEPVYELAVTAGNGVAFVDAEAKLVALQSGTPRVQRKGMLLKMSVAPKLLHPGDIDMLSGNLRYQGDIEVLGSVQDGMTAEATGNIFVRGNVNMGRVAASGSIVITSNMIGSHVAAGLGGPFYADAAPLLSETVQKLTQLRAAIVQVNAATAFKNGDLGRKGLSPLVQVLMQGKFKTLRDLLTRLCQTVAAHRDSLDERWTQYADNLAKAFLRSDGGGLKDVAELESYIRATGVFLDCCETKESGECFVRFSYAHNGTVRCGGDVTVSAGCYQVSLVCQGALTVTGFVRGGDYYARNGADLQEAGTRGGPTRIRVSEKASIRIGNALANTIVQVGAASYKLPEDMSNVHARLNKDGTLLLQ
ncbi:FapA family protein [Paenibacillus sp.]|uniref:FapA family protein n=1 Tax=Paenibacillus sp. TaxID=58172 RepID=UPI00281209B2|nr:FapA family protein [Paenibacillus sp.]